MFFAYGFGNAITFSVLGSATTLLLLGPAEAGGDLRGDRAVSPHRVFGLPTLYTALTSADGAAATDFSSLRMALSAAEVLSADVFHRGRPSPDLRSSKGWGRPKCCTSTFPICQTEKSRRRRRLRVPGYEIAAQGY